MQTLIKNIIRPVYHYVKSKHEREFHRLLDKYGKFPRYTQIKDVRFLDCKFDIPDGASFVWQFREIFVDEIYNFAPKNDTPVILDCGCNVGTSILFFKRKFPAAKVTGFEADTSIADYCVNNLKRNNIHDVTVVNKALWTNNKGIYFASEGADAGSISSNSKGTKVQTVRLRDYLNQEDSIDLLKIDIEGAESEVLEDCKKNLKHVQNIFIEYHSINNNPQRLSTILGILENNGFRYYMETINKQTKPFIYDSSKDYMDLQLNIFARRKYD